MDSVFRRLAIPACLIALTCGTAHAFEDEALPPTGSPSGEAPAPTKRKRSKPVETPVASPAAPTPRALSRIPVQKDAEGTEAPNRFQADTVIKSSYKLEGKTLEVDPD